VSLIPPQLSNISSELNDLERGLRGAAASVTSEAQDPPDGYGPEPTFSSSEEAVQSVLEGLTNQHFPSALRTIRECR
jgi:hypothetical protein